MVASSLKLLLQHHCPGWAAPGMDIEQWSHPSPALGLTWILMVHGRPGLPPVLVPRCRREMTPDDPVRMGGQPGVPSPGRCSIPTQLHPAPAWCTGAGALPAHPCGAEVLVHGWEQPSTLARRLEEAARATRTGLKPRTCAESRTGGAKSPAPRDGRSLLQRPGKLFPGQRHSRRTLALWQELRQS